MNAGTHHARQAVAPRRIQQLDILRAGAVLVVMGHHWALYGSARGILGAVMLRVGWVGVDLFFVLSGYLVSGLLFGEHLRHGRIRVGRFLIRRGLKIYPGFYVFLFLTFFAAHGRNILWTPIGSRESYEALLCEGLFVQNYVLRLWNHTWSLAIEEHFYLLLSLLVLGAARARLLTRARWIGWSAPIVMTMCLAFRAASYTSSGYSWTHIYSRTHMRFDALWFGVCLSYAHHYRRARFEAWVRRRLALVLGMSVALVSTCAWLRQDGFAMCTIGLPCLTVGFGGIMLCALLWPSSRWTTSPFARGLAYVGRHSYSVYLWHMPVLLLCLSPGVAGILHVGSVALLGTYGLVTLIVGTGMAKLVEVPMLRLRDRLYPARSDAVLRHSASL